MVSQQYQRNDDDGGHGDGEATITEDDDCGAPNACGEGSSVTMAPQQQLRQHAEADQLLESTTQSSAVQLDSNGDTAANEDPRDEKG